MSEELMRVITDLHHSGSSFQFVSCKQSTSIASGEVRLSKRYWFSEISCFQKKTISKKEENSNALRHLFIKLFCITCDTQIQKLLLVLGSSRLVAVNAVNVSHISSDCSFYCLSHLWSPVTQVVIPEDR